MENYLAPIAASGLHEKVVEIVSGLPGVDILDVPTGQGALALKLLQMGKRVTAGDIDTAKCGIDKDRPSFRLINMDFNDTYLPLEDNSFDVAISVEGIEHLQCQWHFLRNLQRVVRPGGYLVLTTPNILNFNSRLRYFMEGRYEHFKRPLVKGKSWEDDLDNYHIAPVSLFELQFMMESTGFAIRGIHTNSYRSRNLASILLRPVFNMIYSSKDARDSRRGRGEHGDLYRTVMSDEVYYGESLVILAEKLPC